MKGLHPRNIFSDKNNPDPLNASKEYMGFLVFQAKKMFDGTKQQFSFFDYVLPWRWNSFQQKLKQETTYYLNLCFSDNSKTPLQKYDKMKQIIDENKPNRFNFMRRAERKYYDQLKIQAYQLYILDAFGRGYITPSELSKALLQHITKKNPTNYSQIKAFAEELEIKCKEFERNVAKSKEFTRLTQQLEQYELNSPAKSYLQLSKAIKNSVRPDAECSHDDATLTDFFGLKVAPKSNLPDSQGVIDERVPDMKADIFRDLSLSH
jgi:hypothetical protein